MELTDVLLFLIPLIMTFIGTFCKLKKEGDFTLQSITLWGWVLIVFTMAFLVLGIKNLSDEKTKKDDSEKQMAVMAERIGTLTEDNKSFKEDNKSLKEIIGFLSNKMDTSETKSLRNIDSLKKIVRTQRVQIEGVKANVDICASLSNLKIAKGNGNYHKVTLQICNYGAAPANNIKIQGFMVKKNAYYSLFRNDHPYVLEYSGVVQKETAIDKSFSITNYTGNDTLFLLLKGTYKDEAKRTYSFHKLFRSLPKTDGFDIIEDYNAVDINAFLKSKGLL